MNTALFDICFTRRHVARRRGVRDMLRVEAGSPSGAAKYLLRALKRNSPQGVFSLVSVRPVGPSDAFAKTAKRAKRALRGGKADGERLEVLRAVANGLARAA